MQTPEKKVTRMPNESDEAVKVLFEHAHRDPQLKRELLRNPQAVAEKFQVSFSDDEVQQLQKLGALTELAEEIKFGRLYPRPPIFYPIHVWEVGELMDIFTTLIPGGGVVPSPIFYPAFDFGQFNFATRAYNPGWVSYPGPDDPGSSGTHVGGGHVGGGVIPGPIFYPAGLRNLLAQRLINILKVKQRY